MNKTVIVAGLGLVMGLTGATGIVFTREKQARAAAQALVADSLQAHPDSAAAAHGPPAGEDSTSAVAAHPLPGDSAVVHAASEHGAIAPDAGATAHALQAAPHAAPAAPNPTRNPATGGPAAIKPQQLARMFAEMKPTQAARVLEKMDDMEIQRILGHLREKQAAAILSSLPPQRAADISRAVIRNERSSL